MSFGKVLWLYSSRSCPFLVRFIPRCRVLVVDMNKVFPPLRFRNCRCWCSESSWLMDALLSNHLPKLVGFNGSAVPQPGFSRDGIRLSSLSYLSGSSFHVFIPPQALYHLFHCLHIPSWIAVMSVYFIAFTRLSESRNCLIYPYVISAHSPKTVAYYLA